MALRGYRRLLRARKQLFRGDDFALMESKGALRGAFEVNRFEQDPAKIKEMLKGIDEAEDMMLHGLVQARLNERGNFEVRDIKPVDLGQGEFEPIDADALDNHEKGNAAANIITSAPKDGKKN